jgi:serine phosphatase RsbU (regulator of sigma subunit)
MSWYQKIKKRLQSTFFKHLLILILLVSVLILSVMLINLSNTVEHLATSLINRTTDRIKIELDNFFDPVRKNLRISKELLDEEVMDAVHYQDVNKYMIPLFNNVPAIEVLAIANPQGDEYSLIREDSTWLNNVVYEEKETGYMNILRKRWKGKITSPVIIKEWEDTNAGYDPRTRAWYKGAMNVENNTPFWTDPYEFMFRGSLGITIAMYSVSDYNHYTNVVQFDITLDDISEFTSGLNISENGKSFVLTKDLKIIGLPYDSMLNNHDSVEKYLMRPADSIPVKSMFKAIHKWKELKDSQSKPFSFKVNGRPWWGKLHPYELDNGRVFLIGVLVPEQDFMNEVNNTRNIIVGGFIIVIVFIFISVRGYIQKRKTNLLLKRQNEEIERQRSELQKAHTILEEAHNEINASINYAQRIQNALLPALSEWQKISRDVFVLFKPRDVVSGDFHWSYTTEDGNLSVWAAADCTGHGVPGAFMSMLGIGFLNEIVIEGGETAPAAILQNLRAKIIKALEQKGTENVQKDGMDIALCAWNKKKNLLTFSGANNPLYLIRKTELINQEQKENRKSWHDEERGLSLVEFKPNKQPVGWYGDFMKDFSSEQIIVRKGDVFYTFSDGFADQFGGPEKKKYKYKPFKKLLVSICTKSMDEQSKIIDDTFENWRQSCEQIDDVCVVGIRIV